MKTRTLGLSQKAVLAFLFPLITAALTAGASWVATGNLSTIEIKTAAGGVILSGLALLGAYVGKPGTVVADVGGGKVAVLVPEPAPQAPVFTATSATTSPRPSVTVTNTPPAPEAPAVAPFDPDGEPTTGIGNFTAYTLESFVADPDDKGGATDHPEATA